VEIRTSFPAVPASVPAARRALDPLEGGVPDLVLRNARLLTTELVTNVVRHVAHGQVHLAVTRANGTVRVEVGDDGEGFHRGGAPADPERESGWGLVLIQRAAQRWGTTLEDDRFAVWFELEA
jgi:anti-sigma regulatory factor (Ser/Thr protein kinase)